MTVGQLKDLLDIYDDELEIYNLIKIDGGEYSLEIKGIGTIEEEDRIYIFSKDE
ncbi:MAG: hypothetical protein E6296_06700 [Anaerococcus vaginalis]|uniref:hypothetical protein n=1 Tax=Anaerococcus vaginalis TaxID=33037 RepID=UPI0028FFAE53|nr:hypothetical protein [Anaerococcus vaginalis]MDU2648347.1 hypothetical protein [Anaerococcus vaginalis]MDU7164213.1 hypothetical protein [Anaerococcus vaginalis]